MGVKHTVLPEGQPSTVAFTVLAQLCGSKASETEMGATLFITSIDIRKINYELLFLLFFIIIVIISLKVVLQIQQIQ